MFGSIINGHHRDHIFGSVTKCRKQKCRIQNDRKYLIENNKVEMTKMSNRQKCRK